MSNIQVQLRRGTTTDHSGFAGAVGEVTVDTDLDTLMVHTGGGAGTGVRLAKHSELSGTGAGGTVVSIASGTGLTGGPITTSGTLSLASIANLRALGNVSGGNAAPVAVEIKDEDAMTSNSAIALATQQSIKAYVDNQVAASTVSKYSSGWVNTDGTTSVADGATLTFTHGLGSDSLNIQAYTADNSSGLNMMSLDYDTSSTSFDVGVQIKAVTSTQLTIQLGQDGNSVFDTSGNRTYASLANKYIKVIAIG